MKKSSVLVAVIIPLVSVFLVISLFQQTSCSGGAGRLFGASGGSPLKSNNAVGDALGVQDAFRKVFELNKHRVVFISTEQTVRMQRNPFFDDPFFREFFGNQIPNRQQTQKRTGLGTGFILSEDGYICTNHHVVAGVDKVKVNIDSKVFDANVVGSDERTDIALLKIEPKEKLEPVFLGDSDTVRVGDWAIAIGNPFGLDRTFTVGVVSAVGRKDLDLVGDTQAHIQTDASINPGNSGGPLLNIYGEVIGINRMIYSQTGGNIGIGFAIPVNTAKAVLEQLKTHKKIKRGYLGVQIVPLTEEYARELGLNDNKGALVGQVVEDGPGVKGGVRVGDVILAVAGKPVKDFADLVEIVEKTPIGKPVQVDVWRNKGKMTLFVTVGERP
jgi:serine protease Do